MNGAESIVHTVVDAGVDVCFANPGTTEMDFVTALDTVPGIRAVLALFEGVCTGMADGYARMSDRPALTLLHLGVGLGNGIANLHNARRARSPIVNIVGDHPADHVPYDAPLTSDIATLAAPMSDVTLTLSAPNTAAADAAKAVNLAQGPPGQVVTIIAPADVMRDPSQGAVAPLPTREPALPDDKTIGDIAERLRGDAPSALMLSGQALRERGLVAAHRIAAVTGCEILSESFSARIDRGAGLPPVTRLPYFPEDVLKRLAPYANLILVGARAPVAFFKYPDYPSSLVPEGCELLTLATPHQDLPGALEALAERLDAPADAGKRTELARPGPPTGELDTRTIGAAIANLLPEDAIIADEAATSGGPTYFLTQTCPPHSAMYLTGGGIGWGLPAATGAAVACPERKVLALQADGGGMYTLQALWTQAREGLDVTTILFANRRYEVLRLEQARAGIMTPGKNAESLTRLNDPGLDWCQLAQGMGVPAVSPDSAEAFHRELDKAINEPGPHLIEALI